MSELIIREPKIEDQDSFISSMQRSQSLHLPWVKSPQTKEEFGEYIKRSELTNQKCFLAYDSLRNIDGVWRDHERWALTYEDWIK